MVFRTVHEYAVARADLGRLMTKNDSQITRVILLLSTLVLSPIRNISVAEHEEKKDEAKI